MTQDGQMELEKIWTNLSEEIPFSYDIATDTMFFSERYKTIYKRKPKISNFLKTVRARYALSTQTVTGLEKLQTVLEYGDTTHCIQVQWPNKDEKLEWCEVTFQHVTDKQGKTQAVGIWRNIQRQKREQVMRDYQMAAAYIPGVENHVNIEEQIGKAMNLMEEGDSAALFFIDFDDMKQMREEFGVLAEEELMHMFGQELLLHFQENGIVGHFGIDKFLVYLPNVSDGELAGILAKRIRKIVKGICEQLHLNREITMSVGIALIKEKMSFREAFSQADLALLHGKNAGKNQYVIYSPNMQSEKYSRKLIRGRGDKRKPRYDTGKLWSDLLAKLYETSDLHQGLENAIAFIGNVFQLDKVMVWEYEGDTISNTMQWAREGLPNTQAQQQRIPFCDEEISYAYNSSGIFYCTSVDSMPKRMQEYAAIEQFKELLQARIMGDDQTCLGVIDFALCHDGRVWVQEEIDFLRLMTQVFGEVIYRKHITQKMEEYYNNNRNILDNVVTGIYVVDQETHEVYYYNHAVTEVFPCFENNASVERTTGCGKCGTCLLDAVMAAGNGELKESVVIHNDTTGQDYEVKVASMLWENKKNAYIFTVNEHIASQEELKRRRKQEYLEKRYAFIYSHSCDCIFDIDVDNDWYDVTVVKEGTEWSGLEYHGNYSQMFASAVDQNVVTEDRERLKAKFSLEALQRSISQGDSMITDSFVVYSRKGTLHSKEIRAFIMEEEGHCSVVATYCDVTEERRKEMQDLLERQKLTRAVVNVYPLVLSVNVTQDTFVVMADEIQSMGVVTGDRSISSKILDMAMKLHPEDRDQFITTFSRENLLQHFGEKEEKELTMEFRQRYENDNYHWLTAMVIRIDNPLNEDLLLYIFVRNIDKQKQMEQNLRDALYNAEQASEAKSDFLSRMSHEIRTPMNAIIGMTEIAKTKVEEPESITMYLKKVEVSAQYLLSLINNILDMSRIESNKIVIEKKEFQMKQLLDNIQNIIVPQAKEKGVAFQIETKDLGDAYLGDSLRVSQILLNLLSNSLKFTDAGGSISLSVKENRREGTECYLCFKVSDTGMGMSETFLKNMYKPFEQEDATSAQGMKGTGLGLSITKNLISLMGGHIKCKSRKGEGTTFIVELTMNVVDKQPVMFIDEPPKEKIVDNDQLNLMVGKRVLLAEDNALNQEIAVTMLEMFHIQVDCVENGELAVQSFLEKGSFYYDMILMDIRMPKKNGLDATADIRAIHGKYAEEIPIVAMSANAFAEDKAKAFANGMTDYLVKPIDLDVFRQTLAKYLT